MGYGLTWLGSLLLLVFGLSIGGNLREVILHAALGASNGPILRLKGRIGLGKVVLDQINGLCGLVLHDDGQQGCCEASKLHIR